MSNYNVVDFGAKGDGIACDSIAIQKAVDVCSANGGGDVTIPAGRYLCDSILLKSNVNLYLEQGSRLISSLDMEHVAKDDAFFKENAEFFIGAIQAENVSITGYGELDGRGDETMEKDDGVSEYPLMPAEKRARLCYFRDCSNLKIMNITMLKSAYWTVHLIGCRHVTIKDISILNNLRGANNDGIDPDSCKDVKISGCHIEGGDDAIVIKTTRNAAKMYGNCEDIIISDCTLVSRGSAIKIGTETWADIRNCLFNNCIVRNSNRGLGIWVRDGGTVENISVSNMIFETRMFKGKTRPGSTSDWWGKGEPIFMSACYRNEGVFPGRIQGITVNNIITESENSIFLCGSPESCINDVTLSNLNLHLKMKSGQEGGLFDVQPSEPKVYAHHNPAIYGNYVSGLQIHDVKIIWNEDKSKHWSNAVFCENVNGLSIAGLDGSSAYPDIPAVEVINAENVNIQKE